MARQTTHGMIPIVWIHGYPHSSAIFEPQLEMEGYRHICPDLRGFGKTPPPAGPMTMSDYAGDVFAVMDAEQVDRAVIAGVSMGGYIAMEMYRLAPQRFLAMILLDTRETPDDDAGRAARMQAIETIKTQGPKTITDAMLPKMILSPERQEKGRAILESATPEGMIAALHAMANRPDSTETLRGVTVPAHILVGDRDTITPPSDSERMKTLMQDAELAPIARAAHLANYERPQQVNHILEAWLARKLEA